MLSTLLFMFQSIDKGCLGSQSFLFPAIIFLKYILNAVVQAAFPPLPEFEAGRSYGKTTPVVGTSDFMSRQLEDLFYESPHNLHTTTYHPALRRNPCTYLAFIGSAGKVSIRHLVEAFFGFTFNVYLSFQFVPYKREGNIWVISQLFSFSAFIISKEYKFVVFHSFQQDGACRRMSLAETVATIIAVGSSALWAIASFNHSSNCSKGLSLMVHCVNLPLVYSFLISDILVSIFSTLLLYLEDARVIFIISVSDKAGYRIHLLRSSL